MYEPLSGANKIPTITPAVPEIKMVIIIDGIFILLSNLNMYVTKYLICFD